MKSIPTSSLIAGKQFTKAIYLDSKTLFIKENVVISEKDIENLKKYGVKEVLCDGDMVDPPVTASAQTPIVEDLSIGNTSHLPDEQIPLKTNLEKLIHSRTVFSNSFRNAVSSVQSWYRMIHEGKAFEARDMRTVTEEIADAVRNTDNLSYLLLSQPQESYYLYHHVVLSTFYSAIIGHHCEYSRPKLIELITGALLADVGMVHVPSSVSEKSTQLNDTDIKHIMKHSITGYQILTQKIKLKASIAAIALQHHENSDATGYPQKKPGRELEEFTRIFTVADNFSAMICKRPHRNPLLPHEAMKIMIGQNVNKFDPRLVRMLLNILSLYPVGSSVELSNGSKGIVVAANKDKPLRPIVRILIQADGSPQTQLRFVDLLKDVTLLVTKAIPLKVNAG